MCRCWRRECFFTSFHSEKSSTESPQGTSLSYAPVVHIGPRTPSYECPPLLRQVFPRVRDYEYLRRRSSSLTTISLAEASSVIAILSTPWRLRISERYSISDV